MDIGVPKNPGKPSNKKKHKEESDKAITNGTEGTLMGKGPH